MKFKLGMGGWPIHTRENITKFCPSIFQLGQQRKINFEASLHDIAHCSISFMEFWPIFLFTRFFAWG